MQHQVFAGAVGAFWLLTTGVCSARDSSGGHAVGFVSPDGRVLEIDLAEKTISVPGRDTRSLLDCGDEFQVCLTDTHGFLFAFFKKCADSAQKIGDKRLRFSPQVASVLHEHLRLAFDGAPKFMFDYSLTHGLVGIYYDEKHYRSFRALLKLNQLRLQTLTEHEFILRGEREITVCEQ